ncbi:CBS domain-containing protein [Alicyclobacillus sp.]|uniref:CBS domain-containing protein n=1 Tax=Alicyclobacillus sp. TaxID=61169 RepID=UPI0025BBDA17|nr:CBS domain-containing protein [Alicyclobacillus sp.]MCL6516849.1 CBS domain-containing protein [Alicyclobacillus sp.]
MKARDIMIHSVIKAHVEDDVKSVLRKFVEHGIGGMPIVDNGNRVVGYISDGDIMRAFSRHYSRFRTIDTGYYVVSFFTGIDADNDEEDADFRAHFQEFCRQKAIDAGVRRAVCVQEEDTLEAVAKILSERKIKKVPVVRSGVLVGIISRGDVIRQVVHRFMES